MRKLFVGLALVLAVGVTEARADDMTVKEWLDRCGHKLADNPKKDVTDHIDLNNSSNENFDRSLCILRTSNFLNGVYYTLYIQLGVYKETNDICLVDYFKRNGKQVFPGVAEFVRQDAINSTHALQLGFPTVLAAGMVLMEMKCRGGELE